MLTGQPIHPAKSQDTPGFKPTPQVPHSYPQVSFSAQTAESWFLRRGREHCQEPTQA